MAFNAFKKGEGALLPICHLPYSKSEVTLQWQADRVPPPFSPHSLYADGPLG